MKLVNLPNFISLGRLLTVPVIIWLILSNHWFYAFVVFLAAGVSDILDGLFARLLQDQTTIGRYLDPIADKILLGGVIITLGFLGKIPSWLAILIVFRDFLILGGALLILVMNRPVEIEPIMISKVNTLLTIGFVTYLLWAEAIYQSWPQITDMWYILITVTTVLSGLAYIWKWVIGIDNDGKAHEISGKSD